MATEILVKDPLEKEWIDGGKELLKRLARTDFKVVAALWLWERERPHWQLVLASPFVTQNGTREAHHKIWEALREKPHPFLEWELMDVHAMATTEPLIRALRSQAKKYNTDLAGRRLREYWVGDMAVDDAYIYFVK